ncbi:phytoene desaturase family protein [Rathayibacter sp. YIM 133350]|uniref:phytoene desaturase family protein n=1 Tax=Rathayibacter sp. YIM 133350 TaxID=3131992 RepID=UPI00307D878F
MTRTVIIGGGIAGLATAALLAREGRQVTLLEANATLGGRAGLWESAGFRFDTGPSWYLMPEVFDHFYRLLGTSAAEQLDLRTLDPGYRLYFEGTSQPVDVAASREANIRLFESIEPGAGAALERYLRSAEGAYRDAVERFLYTDFSSLAAIRSPGLGARVPALLRLLTQSLDTYVSRRFRDRRLRQILGYPAVFLGSSPFDAPALYHLMSHLDLADGVRYPQGGFRTLIDSIARLARENGALLLTGARVRAITTTSESPVSVTGVQVEIDGSLQQIAADEVVSCADLHHTETELLPAAQRTYPERWWRRRNPGPGAVLVMLGVRGRLPQLAHHTLVFTADWRTNFARIFGARPGVPEPASFYVSMPSATDPSVAPADHESLFLLIPVPADPSIGAGGLEGDGDAAVESAADAAIDRLAQWAGIPDLRERIVLRRTVGPADFASDLNAWQGGALGPAHTLRQSAFLRGSNRSHRVRGLSYAGGTTIPGVGLPMCLISAELQLKRVRGEVAPGPVAVADAVAAES